MTKLQYQPEKPPFNFLGVKSTFSKSKVVVLPIPLELTTSYIRGTKNGPKAIINASREIEFYDIELDKVISEICIFTVDSLKFSNKSYQAIFQNIYQSAKNLLKNNKFLVSLGGEHSLTHGLVKAFKEKYENLSILQLDAHIDLRDEYEGTKFSHACAMSRCYELVDKIVHVGIRSMCEEEAENVKKKKIRTIHFAPKVDIEKILSQLTDNVYLTFDLDCFDPSIMPSVGTPEPGGLGWYEILNLIKKVAKYKNIVGFDVVELCPIKNLIFPDFLAAKLVYKIIGYQFFSK
jgi:agmatinase